MSGSSSSALPEPPRLWFRTGNSLRSIPLFLLRYLLIAALIAACGYAVILARAGYLFHEDTAKSVPAAVALVPYNSEYVARLAAWQPAQRVALLHRAVALDPCDYQSWIQLGLISELQEQNIAQAERDYRKAAQVNHMFLPKWTLMNFYFRRQNQSEFFRWAKETLAITPYSSDPVFAQMWLMTQHAPAIAAAIPDRARILVQYAWFLSNNRQFPAIPPIVNRLVATAGNSDPHAWGRDDLVAAIEDRLLASADVNGALQVWASMQRGGWLHESIPSPAHPITNGDFAAPLYPHGFDWQIDSTPGATVDNFPDEKALRITLSGDQPESCLLLRQYIPLDPGRSYHLQWSATAGQIEDPRGLTWHVRPVGIESHNDLSSGDIVGAANSWDFRSPARVNLCLLTLEYARPLGTVRARGSVSLRSVSLTEQ
jgi:hypothetical protein